MFLILDSETGKVGPFWDDPNNPIGEGENEKIETFEDITASGFDAMLREDAGGNYGEAWLTDGALAEAGTRGKPKKEVLRGKRINAEPPKEKIETIEDALVEQFRRTGKRPNAGIRVEDVTAAMKILEEGRG